MTNNDNDDDDNNDSDNNNYRDLTKDIKETRSNGKTR